MPKFRVCIKGEPPPAEFVVEIKEIRSNCFPRDLADSIAREDLYNWADLVELEIHPEESVDVKAQPAAS